MKRIGQRVSLYRQLLNDFLDDYRDISQELQQLSDNQLLDDLFIKAHTLKSNAAYLGAMLLHEKSEQLEQCLAQQQNHHMALQQVSMVAEELISQLWPIMENDTQQTPDQHQGFDIQAVIDLLADIQPLLEESDFEAESHLVLLRRCTENTWLFDQVVRLCSLVNAVEFEQAVILADTLKQQLLAARTKSDPIQ